MQKKNIFKIIISAFFLLLFVAFTLLVKFVNVSPAGESMARVGFSRMNDLFFNFVGRKEVWHKVSSVLLVVALLFDVIIVVFAVLELIKKKSLKAIDKEYYLIFGLYILTIVCYVLFELVVVNCRPVLEEGVLEASYPSSHVFIGLVSLWTVIVFVKNHITKKSLRNVLYVFLGVVAVLLVVTRILSGMHWITDIIGALLLSIFLISLYVSIKSLIIKNQNK